jgi:uncharacterized protein (TIGR02145 family)
MFLFLTHCSEDNVEPDCDKVGQACDDGNPLTENDKYNSDCECEGTLICTIGNPCDDNDPDTYNDVYDANCNCAGTPNMFTDPRDGESYTALTIGGQTWFGRNLAYEPASGGSSCYDNDPANCAVYGRLYDWQTAMNACPDGWHLPSKQEWEEMIEFLGGVAVAGGKLKETGFEHWMEPNTGATNESGFTGLPSGGEIDNSFDNLGRTAYFWTSTLHNDQYAWYPVLLNNTTTANMGYTDDPFKFCVRCIRDSGGN